MLTNMKLNQIIQHKLDGKSNREVAKLCNVNRKTVARKYKDYQEGVIRLELDNKDKEAKEIIAAGRKYDSSSRNKPAYTKDVENIVINLLQDEIERDRILGDNKLRLTNDMILSEVKSHGHDIGLSTIATNVKKLRTKIKEAYIKQHYNFGERSEYDFGEVKLIINGAKTTLYLAVISSPASNYRWVRMYDNQGMEVFKDSHVKFFEEVGGVYSEMCYDNMRNVVSRFVGKNGKELNQQLVQMSTYYGFKINVTNAFSGNEKGHVEGSVKYTRNQFFSRNYKFDSLNDVNEYVEKQLKKINASCQIEDEKKHLRDYRPPFEIADYRQVTVNKYSFIQINTKTYSVPEELVGKRLNAKIYVDIIRLYDGTQHKVDITPITGNETHYIQILHYQKTLFKKPGAFKRSLALSQHPQLKKLFDDSYSNNPREFITLLIDNSELSYADLISKVKAMQLSTASSEVDLIDEDFIQQEINAGYNALNAFMNGGDVIEQTN